MASESDDKKKEGPDSSGTSEKESAENNSEGPSESLFSRLKRNTSSVLLGACLIFVTVFVVQNLNTVSIRFLWMEQRLVLSVALLLAVILGMVIAWTLTKIRSRKKRD